MYAFSRRLFVAILCKQDFIHKTEKYVAEIIKKNRDAVNTQGDSEVILFRIYTVSQKKQDTKLLAITSPTIIRFSIFFH